MKFCKKKYSKRFVSRNVGWNDVMPFYFRLFHSTAPYLGKMESAGRGQATYALPQSREGGRDRSNGKSSTAPAGIGNTEMIDSHSWKLIRIIRAPKRICPGSIVRLSGLLVSRIFDESAIETPLLVCAFFSSFVHPSTEQGERDLPNSARYYLSRFRAIDEFWISARSTLVTRSVTLLDGERGSNFAQCLWDRWRDIDPDTHVRGDDRSVHRSSVTARLCLVIIPNYIDGYVCACLCVECWEAEGSRSWDLAREIRRSCIFKNPKQELA